MREACSNLVPRAFGNYTFNLQLDRRTQNYYITPNDEPQTDTINNNRLTTLNFQTTVQLFVNFRHKLNRNNKYRFCCSTKINTLFFDEQGNPLKIHQKQQPQAASLYINTISHLNINTKRTLTYKKSFSELNIRAENNENYCKQKIFFFLTNTIATNLNSERKTSERQRPITTAPLRLLLNAVLVYSVYTTIQRSYQLLHNTSLRRRARKRRIHMSNKDTYTAT